MARMIWVMKSDVPIKNSFSSKKTTKIGTTALIKSVQNGAVVFWDAMIVWTVISNVLLNIETISKSAHAR